MACAVLPLLSQIDNCLPPRRESVGRESLDGATSCSPPSSSYQDTIFSGSRCSSTNLTMSSSRGNSPLSQSLPQAAAAIIINNNNDNKNDSAFVDQSKLAGRPRPEPIRTGHPFTSQILSPRPYEQIYAEMSYLTGSLHSEALKTAKLIGHYSLVEEALRGEAAVGKHRRRLRKQLSSLKCRIAQASLQEKAIRVRLSELQMEAQSRTTWCQLQQQRVMPDAGPLSAASTTFADRCPQWMGMAGHEARPTSNCLPSPAPSPSSTSGKKLNAACLEFVPGRPIISQQQQQHHHHHHHQHQQEHKQQQQQQQHGQQQDQLDPGADSRENAGADGNPRTPDEAGVPIRSGGEEGLDRFRNRGLQYSYERRDRAKGSRLIVLAGGGSTTKPAAQRRLSLPAVNFFWPES